MKIDFFSLRRQYKLIGKELSAVANKILESGNFILGQEVKAFEEGFSHYCGSSYAIGVASGTEALALALMACNVGRGDEVITVPNTATATVCAIEMTGAKPVFVDIGEDYLIDVKKIQRAITKKTKAIIPVHLYGLICDMEEINCIAKDNKLFVIEDAAQSHGSLYRGRKAGSLGTAGCFSFYPTKNLGCFGDGGAITTANLKLYKKLLLLRNYGWGKRYISEIKGLNSRLDEIQAAFLRIRLKYLDEFNRKRRRLAAIYKNHIDRKNCFLPTEAEDKLHTFHMFVIRARNRDKLRSFLKRNEITTAVHYPVPVHLQKAFKDFGYRRGDFPVAERMVNQILSLPIYPELTEQEVLYVSKKINSFYE